VERLGGPRGRCRQRRGPRQRRQLETATSSTCLAGTPDLLPSVLRGSLAWAAILRAHRGGRLHRGRRARAPWLSVGACGPVAARWTGWARAGRRRPPHFDASRLPPGGARWTPRRGSPGWGSTEQTLVIGAPADPWRVAGGRSRPRDPTHDETMRRATAERPLTKRGTAEVEPQREPERAHVSTRGRLEQSADGARHSAATLLDARRSRPLHVRGSRSSCFARPPELRLRVPSRGRLAPTWSRSCVGSRGRDRRPSHGATGRRGAR